MYASVEWCATTDDYRRLRLWNWIKLNVYFQQDVAMETIQTKIRYPLLLFNIHTLITFTSYYDTRSYRERWWSDQDESNWIVFFLIHKFTFPVKQWIQKYSRSYDFENCCCKIDYQNSIFPVNLVFGVIWTIAMDITDAPKMLFYAICDGDEHRIERIFCYFNSIVMYFNGGVI